MTTFVFTETVPNQLESAALGANSGGKFVSADLNKAVKLGTANNFVLATNGDEIDGFVKAIEPFTVNDGFSFGGVQREGRVSAVVGANQVSTMAVGDYVVADTQVALGTAGAAKVRTGTAFAQSGTTPFGVTNSTPARALWRCIRIVSGTGAAGDPVILERV